MTARRRRPPTPLLLSVAAVVAAGCDRAAPPAPAGRPAPATRAAAAPADPVPSVLTISNQAYDFPPAYLILDERDAGVVAQVFSEGASPEGANDGFYLEMTLAIPDASQLDGASWQHTSGSGTRSDSPTAITVNRGANQLQPRDVTATFRVTSPDTVEVRLNGFFNVFAGRDAAVAADTVPVEATLVTRRLAQ
jgi:hypothetical protein